MLLERLKPILVGICSRSGWRGQGRGKAAATGRLSATGRLNSDRLIFLYAFSKKAKANISSKEEAALSLNAEAFLAATDQQVSALLANGAIWEVKDDE